MNHATTWRVVANAVLMMTALCCVPKTSTSASDSQRVTNQEYRFSVVFPRGVNVCTATSGDQPHGFFVRLNASQADCGSVDKELDVSVISVFAYSNATFENSPEEETGGLCRKSGARDEIGAIKALGFVGRHSAKCHLQQTDGSIDIYVVTQAGRWPGAHGSQELNAPYVNYTASLHTTRSRVSEDLKAFRRVLNSIRIGYAK